MNEQAAFLWGRVLKALDERKWRFAVGLTPQQVGSLVLEISLDPRVLKFVREFYYPRAFGGGSTACMRDAEAEALARSLETDGPRPPRADIVLTLSDVRCSLCGDKVEAPDEPK